MAKKDKIKYLVAEYAKSFGIGSTEWENIFIKQDSIINKLNNYWREAIINEFYDDFKNSKRTIKNIMNILL